MSKALLGTFKFSDVLVEIDGIPVSKRDFAGDDDSISIDQADSNSEILKGVGGGITVSISEDESAIITMKLSPLSNTYQLLMERNRQLRDGDVRPFSFSVTNLVTGEGGTTDEGLVVNKPAQAFGKSAGSRDVQILAPCWNESFLTFT